jgi:hypothetical protein
MADYTYSKIDDELAEKHDKALLAAQVYLLETIPKVTANAPGGNLTRNLAESYALLRGAAVQAGGRHSDG